MALTMMINREQMKAWLEASCLAQGIQVAITDPVTVAQIAALLSRQDAAGEPHSGDRSNRRLEPPSWNNPVRIQMLRAGGSGLNSGVIKDGANDGGLPVEVEHLPPSTEFLALTNESF